MLIRHAVQHVGTIFNQEEIVSVAERAKFLHVARKAKVVDRQNGSDIATDFRLEIRPIRRAISLNRIEFNLRTEVLDWFNSRRAKISGNQDFLPGSNPQGAQTMENSVAGPKEIEARRACGLPRTVRNVNAAGEKRGSCGTSRPGIAVRGWSVQSNSC